jgi:hypothetical protein
VTEYDTLTAAVRELRDRPTGLPVSCNPLIARILERVIEEVVAEGEAHQFFGCEEPVLALAVMLAPWGVARSCDCGKVPDPGICQRDCAPWHPAGGHCACVHGEDAS